MSKFGSSSNRWLQDDVEIFPPGPFEMLGRNVSSGENSILAKLDYFN